MNIVFILVLPTYWKHAGMAFSTVIAEAAGMATLGIILTRRMKNLQWLEIFRSFNRCLLGALVMAIAAWATAWADAWAAQIEQLKLLIELEQKALED